jgi:hypothetical protein
VPCYPYGLNQAEFIQGVVQNPTAPTSVVTATTPIGIAYESIAGGAQPKNFPSGPTWNEGTPSNPANSSCKYYPGYEVYNSVQQVFTNTDYSTTNTQPAGNYLTTVPSNPTYPYATPLLPWPLVTRWFYSSYLANSYPPSQGEIYSQTNNNSYTNSKTGKITQSYNLDIPSLGNIVANVFTPSETICAPNLRTTPPYQTMPTDGDFLIKTTLPSSGNTNASLFILKQQSGAAYLTPAAAAASLGVTVLATPSASSINTFTPAGTPGYQYSDLSCQAYGNNIFTFYWNDMGGSGYNDDIDYGNGSVQISCKNSASVVLIQ